MILKIFDDIMNDQDACDIRFWDPTRGVCFKDIDEFIAAIPEDDGEIDLRLNSCGGDVNTGWAIVDKLRASGKKIVATVEGIAASTASIILMAASERRAYPHSQLCIHNPYIIGWSIDGKCDAGRLQKMGAELQKEQNRFVDFYVERTGADRARIEAIMREDRIMYVDEAKELGIITEILPPLSAAYRLKPIKTRDMAKKTQTLGAFAKAMAALQEALGLDSPAPQGYTLETADGSELTIDKPEGEDPAVGDSASPDGEHEMPDGTTIVVVDGVITEIRPAEDDDPDGTYEEELARLVAEVKDLKANAKTDEEKDILAKVKAAGGLAWLDKAITGRYTPAPRTPVRKKTEAKTSRVAERLAEMKEAARKQY